MARNDCNYQSDYDFKVTQTKNGQPKPYADSEYEYTIESSSPEGTVKCFCTGVIYPCKQDYEHWDKDNAASYFRGYYTFRKVSENTYKNTVRKPFCD